MNSIHKAELVARKFIREYRFSIPFNIYKAINILNLTLMYDSSLEKLPAMTHTNNAGDKIIVVNANNKPEVQRFSICHEIGHILLKHKGRFHFNPNVEERRPEERYSDICASELLIPRHKLALIAYENNFDVKKLKKIFQVSEYAMVVKMKVVNLPFKNTFYEEEKIFSS